MASNSSKETVTKGPQVEERQKGPGGRLLDPVSRFDGGDTHSSSKPAFLVDANHGLTWRGSRQKRNGDGDESSQESQDAA